MNDWIKEIKPENLISRQIGRNLRALRLRSGYSQQKVGEVLDVSFQQIQKYENGTNRISAEKLYILQYLFKAPFESFYKGVEHEFRHDETSHMRHWAEINTIFAEVKQRLILSENPVLCKKICRIVLIILNL